MNKAKIEETVNFIILRQVMRKYVIKLEVANLNTTSSYIARLCGFDATEDEESRAKVWARAKGIVKTAFNEKDQKPEDKKVADAAKHELAMAREMMLPLTTRREEIETEMECAATTLPVSKFLENVPGVKAIGLAVIIGEAGNLSNYSSIRKLWRRLGFGMAEGHEAHAYSTWRMKGGLTADDWTRAGYSPKRLGQIYGVISVPLNMHKAKGKYGVVYNKRRAQTLVSHPEWYLDKNGKQKLSPKGEPSSAHAMNDAIRIMTKSFLKDLYTEWNRSMQSVPINNYLVETVPKASRASTSKRVFVGA